MKLFYLFIFSLLFFFSQTFFGFSASAFSPSCPITTTLRVGSTGEQVKCLQERIGTKVDGKFGPMTKASVVFWQSGHGLLPDGIVGPLTRTIINSITTVGDVYPAGCSSFYGYSVTTGKKCNTSSLTAPDPVEQTNNTNPDLTNLDQFIGTVVLVAQEKGLNKNEVTIIADSLREEVASSRINYNEEFKEMLVNEANASYVLQSSVTIFDKVLAKALSFLGIVPRVAQAAVGEPFGGTLIFPFYCPVSGNWMITITPLPPTYVVLLSYTPGTQGFASYNIPYTKNLLGFYAGNGNCRYQVGPYTVTIPTQGTVGKMVGSSPS
ncbi:MAG: peptidoglycan-binding domain-containing protein [Candidatus Paceibacterota bacterium]